MRPPTLTFGALALAIAATALVATPASAASMSVSTLGELSTALASAGSSSVTAAISAPMATVAVADGIVTLDLNGHDVAVQRVEIAQTATFRITNSSQTRATFTADASMLTNDAGIRSTLATLEIGGNADVIARGGSAGAGVGGDRGNGGGVTKVSGTATLRATGASKAAGIGGGEDGGGNILPSLTISDTAVVTVEADSAAPSAIGDAKSIGIVTVGAGSKLIIPIGTTVVAKEATGSKLANSGTIVVDGTLTGDSTSVTNTGAISGTGTVDLKAQGAKYVITFDANAGVVQGAASVTVYADTFAAATIALPTATRTGYGFDGWSLAGSALRSTTSLATALGSTVKAGTAIAVWKGSGAVTLATIGDVAHGDKLTLVATVADGLSGTVEFFADDTTLGTVTTKNGTARLDLTWSLPVASYAITARFSNSDSAGTSDAQKVTIARGTTVLSFVTASDTVSSGRSTAVLAQVTPRTATGTVRFSYGTADFVDVPLNDGSAVFPTPTSLAMGSYTVLATYSGSANSYSSVGTHALTVTAAVVTPVPTVIVDTSTPPVVVAGSAGTAGSAGNDGTAGSNGANGANGTSTVSIQSTTSTVTVMIPAKATTVVTVSAKKFAKRTKPKLTVSVGTASAVGGKLAIYVGKKKVKTVTVTKKVISVTLSKKYAKALSVKAVFLGTAAVAKAASKTVKIKVK